MEYVHVVEKQMGSDIMILPVKNAIITSPYGYRKDPFGSDTKVFHDGIDFISSNNDRRIFSITKGIIVYDFDDYNHKFKNEKPNTGGNMVIVTSMIDDITYHIRYLHLLVNFVAKGQYINEGDYIGDYADVGISKGPHVHIDFYTSNWSKKIDPTPLFLKAGLLGG